MDEGDILPEEIVRNEAYLIEESPEQVITVLR